MTLSDGGKSRKIKEVASHASIFEEDQEGRSYPAQGSKTKAGATGKEIFKGREFGDIDPKELKRIQIDIKRSIPSHRVSTSPIRRRVVNPKTVVISRRKVLKFTSSKSRNHAVGGKRQRPRQTCS